MDQGELHGLALRIKDRLGREVPSAIFEGPTQHGDGALMREITGMFEQEGLLIRVTPSGWEAWDHRDTPQRRLSAGSHDDCEDLIERCRAWPLDPD